MKFKNVLSPRKGKIILFSIFAFIYIVFRLEILFRTKCLANINCFDTPKHTVLNIFPGNMCGQVCATSSEIFWGYVQASITHIILPLLVVYLLLGLIFEVVKPTH